MAKSNYVFDQGAAIDVGSHGNHDYLFHSGEPVSDTGKSGLVYESGSGLGPAQAIVDDFEDGDLTEYSVIQNGSYQITTSPVFEGNYGLQLTPDTTNEVAIVSTTGLPNYPSAGNTFEFYWSSDVVQDAMATYWAVQDETSNFHGYGIDGMNQNGFFRLRKYQGGTGGNATTTLDTTTFGWNTGEWYRIEIEWGTDGSLICRAYDGNDNHLGTVSGNDTEWTSGGIGWRVFDNNTNATRYYDYFRITG